MKRIKNLCYEQLQGMSVDEIKRALQLEDSLPAAVSSTQVEVTSSPSNQMQPTMSVSKTTDIFVEKSGNKDMNKDTEVVPTQSHRVDDNNKHTMKDSLTEDKRETSPPQAQSGDEEVVVHVSDVSGEKEGDDNSRQAESMKKSGAKRDDASEASPPVLKEEYTVTSLSIAEQSKQLEEKIKNSEDQTQVLKPKNAAKSVVVYKVLRSDDTNASSDSEVEENTIHNVGSKELKLDEILVHSDSGSSVEDSGMDDLDVDVSELDATQLLEMEMRRRALESELKKFSDNKPTATMKIQTSPQNSGHTSPSDEDCAIEVYVSDSEALDCDSQTGGLGKKQSSPLNNHEKRESQAHVGPSELSVETDTMDIGQLLEMKLRQKALQSLLKKRQNSTQ